MNRLSKRFSLLCNVIFVCVLICFCLFFFFPQRSVWSSIILRGVILKRRRSRQSHVSWELHSADSDGTEPYDRRSAGEYPNPVLIRIGASLIVVNDIGYIITVVANSINTNVYILYETEFSVYTDIFVLRRR